MLEKTEGESATLEGVTPAFQAGSAGSNPAGDIRSSGGLKPGSRLNSGQKHPPSSPQPHHAALLAGRAGRGRKPSRPGDPPSDRQDAALRFIAKFLRKHQYAPSVREICAGIVPRGRKPGSSNHCAEILAALERKDFIQRTPRVSRSIRLTPRALLWLAGSEAA